MIDVHLEPGGISPIRENCCFCRQPTRYWTDPNGVACCRACASVFSPEDVPSKEKWCKVEDLICKGRVKFGFARG